jgi:hypothetical protein
LKARFGGGVILNPHGAPDFQPGTTMTGKMPALLSATRGSETWRQALKSQVPRLKTLQQCIESKGLSIEEMLDLGIQITDALDATHAKRIIHRGTTPTNIIITEAR